MKQIKRVFLFVLDSFGVGALPDAADFGDEGCDTLRSISKSPAFSAPNLLKMGLSRIPGLERLPEGGEPVAAFGKLAELSRAKDTTAGHWEIAGVVTEKPFPTYPKGFPEELLERFSHRCGRGVLCNAPYSGTEVIKDYGREHLETGKLIVYTSQDSVFQIAAHERKVPLEELYRCCRIARELLTGEHGVGRVIARPFLGDPTEGFYRTENRKDFSMEPTGRTLLDALADAGRDVIGVGKISDIFAGRGITENVPVHGNVECMKAAFDLLDRDFFGLCFVNLVDFDMVFGHRNDVDGYAAAVSVFDRYLDSFIPKMKEGDVLIITADHGCDPGDVSTDHTREYVPLLIFGDGISPVSLGVGDTFARIAATVADMFGADFDKSGSYYPIIRRR